MGGKSCRLNISTSLMGNGMIPLEGTRDSRKSMSSAAAIRRDSSSICRHYLSINRWLANVCLRLGSSRTHGQCCGGSIAALHFSGNGRYVKLHIVTDSGRSRQRLSIHLLITRGTPAKP